MVHRSRWNTFPLRFSNPLRRVRKPFDVSVICSDRAANAVFVAEPSPPGTGNAWPGPHRRGQHKSRGHGSAASPAPSGAREASARDGHYHRGMLTCIVVLLMRKPARNSAAVAPPDANKGLVRQHVNRAPARS
jgi:hypothetical protein